MADKIVVLTTTNGTKALLRASSAAATAVAGLVNVKATAQWAQDQARPFPSSGTDS